MKELELDADLVVGAQGANGGPGTAYVYLGSASGLASSPATTLTGPDGGYFGQSEGLLLQGCSDANPKTAGTCREMGNVREAFWTFARIEGVEPTNNAAERSIRFGVLWRRRSHGTMSKKGSAFVARILTVHATLRQQKRSVHDFLRAACAAHRAKRAPPSLLPHTEP